MNSLGPYDADELRLMRRLIIASGSDIAAWCTRLRRSADFLQSLSPEQAGIVAEQAAAIAASPTDYGGEEALAAERERMSLILEAERAAFTWREIVTLRRRHYPGPLGSEEA